MAKVSEAISRVRNTLKTVREDPFMTDRYIYSLIMKYGKTLIFRDRKRVNLFKNSGLFRELPCVELIEVDAVEACCTGIKTGCTFRRSRYKLPKIMELDGGPVIRAVSTLDYSITLNKTEPLLYMTASKTTDFKYNNIRYYWINENYIFIPAVEWEAVRIQAIFEEDISKELCSIEDKDACLLEQERPIAIPEYLFTEIETAIRQELGGTIQIPSDDANDKQSLYR